MGFEIQVMAHKCGGIKSVNGTLTLMWQLSPQRKYKHKQTIKHRRKLCLTVSVLLCYTLWTIEWFWMNFYCNFIVYTPFYVELSNSLLNLNWVTMWSFEKNPSKHHINKLLLSMLLIHIRFHTVLHRTPLLNT